MAGKKLKTASKQKPDSQDEAGMLSDALREERLRRALSDLHTAMDGQPKNTRTLMDNVDRSDWPEPEIL